MRRRTLLQSAAGLLAAPCLGLGQAGRRKNVLIVMSDQHRRDCLGAAGNGVVRTPNLDALAGGSVRFGNAYCSNPVCTPSRASLLTGLYTHNHQALNNTSPLPMEHPTLAHHFARAGYATG